MKKFLSILLIALMAFSAFSGCTAQDVADIVELSYDIVQIVEEVASSDSDTKSPAPDSSAQLDENGVYTSAEDVALYIHTFGKRPSNFVTKNQAREAGWNGGSLEPYLPGMCIGGDYFGNKEGILPKAGGRKWTECDIDTLGADSRGAKRIVFSNDGLIYYTDDHYESFTLLYGNP